MCVCVGVRTDVSRPFNHASSRVISHPPPNEQQQTKAGYLALSSKAKATKTRPTVAFLDIDTWASQVRVHACQTTDGRTDGPVDWTSPPPTA